MNKKGFSIIILSILLLSLAGVYIYTATNKTEEQTNTNQHTNPTSTNTEYAPWWTVNTTYTLTDIPEIEKIITPPFIEAKFLYKPFPIVVYAEQPINPAKITLLIKDKPGDQYKLKIIETSYLGQNNTTHVYIIKAQIGPGYYPTGQYPITIIYNNKAETYNLSILSPTEKPNIQIEQITIEHEKLVIKITNNKTQIINLRIQVANCNITTRESINPQENKTINIDLEETWCKEAPHLTIIITTTTDAIFYQFVTTNK